MRNTLRRWTGCEGTEWSALSPVQMRRLRIQRPEESRALRITAPSLRRAVWRALGDVATRVCCGIDGFIIEPCWDTESSALDLEESVLCAALNHDQTALLLKRCSACPLSFSPRGRATCMFMSVWAPLICPRRVAIGSLPRPKVGRLVVSAGQLTQLVQSELGHRFGGSRESTRYVRWNVPLDRYRQRGRLEVCKESFLLA